MKSRQPYTKHNSRTQQDCNSAAETVQGIITAMRITKEEWLHLLFETGCQLVETQKPEEEVRRYILQDVTCGFWAWWITAFVAHDEKLLQMRGTPHSYKRQKDYMVKQVRIDFIGETFLRK